MRPFITRHSAYLQNLTFAFRFKPCTERDIMENKFAPTQPAESGIVKLADYVNGVVHVDIARFLGLDFERERHYYGPND